MCLVQDLVCQSFVKFKKFEIYILSVQFNSRIKSQFVALGTHLGAVHVLDHEGNRIREKLFEKVSYLLDL